MTDYKTQTFQKGDIILKEGDKPEYAYILKSGSAKIFKDKEDGSKIQLCHLKAGEIIGEMSLIDTAPRSASVIAAEKTDVIIIDQDSFEKSLETLDAFAQKLIKTIVKRLRVQNKQIAELIEPYNLLKAAEKGQLNAEKTAPTRVVFQEDYRTKLNFGAINCVIVSTNSQTRQSIKGGLHLQGFREIADCSNAIDFRALCALNDYDLLYIDNSIGVDQASAIIDDIRHNKTSVNPFSIIFAAIEQPDPKTLEKFAESGLDDVLVKPVTIGNIIDRVEKRIKTRKPFVVTLDYIGPDRRSNTRPGTEEIPLVDVPNPVQFKALDQMDQATFQRLTDVAIQRIKDLKIERHAVQIDWLRGKIKTMNDEHQDPSYFLKKTRDVAQALVERLREIEDDVHIALCNRVISNISDFEAGMAEMDGADWDSFANLTRNLKLNLGPKLAASPA